jgi:hypothetical protein
LQEWILDKGILQSIQDHDAAGVGALGLFTLAMVTIGGRFLAELPGSIDLPNSNSPSTKESTFKSLSDIFKPNEDRTWNFNDGQSPFGFKKNAEIWNGRLAQVCVYIPFQ